MIIENEMPEHTRKLWLRRSLLAAVVSIISILAIAGFSYSFYVAARNTVTNATEELHQYTLKSLHDLASIHVSSFDWPQVESLIETSLQRADVDGFWIKDNLSQKTFGTPVTGPLKPYQELHDSALLLGDRPIGQVYLLSNTQARDVELALIRNFVMTSAGGMAIFVLALIWGILKVLQQSQRRAVTELAKQQLEERVLQRTQELEIMTQRADDASKAKSRFLATMSHELRTPMNGIIGMTEVIETRELDRDTRRQLETVRLSANSLLGIINDILDFSSIEVGRLNISSAPIDLEAEINAVCALLGQVAGQQDNLLTAYVDPAIPADLLGDSLRVRQVVTNLVGNGLKFSSAMTKRGQVDVSARMISRDDATVTVEISVRDNGVGVRKEDQKRLFQPFEQVKQSTGTTMGGTGLGLAISRELATVMGGDISLVSEFGNGAEFTFRVPLKINHDTAARTPLLKGIQVITTCADNPLQARYVTYLKAEGAKILTPDERPNLTRKLAGVILPSDPDIQLQAIADLRAQHPGISCLVIGAYGDAELPDRPSGVDWVSGSYLTRTPLAKRLRGLLISADQPTESSIHAPDKFTNLKPILVAEDNMVNQTVIRSQLNLLGLMADVAQDGAEAYDLWVAGDYDLLLTDIQMPRMNGFELADKIRQDEANGEGSRLSIIALSADVQKEQIALEPFR